MIRIKESVEELYHADSKPEFIMNLIANIINCAFVNIVCILQDFMFIYTVFAISIKNQLFMILLNSDGASKIDKGISFNKLFTPHIYLWFILIFISFTFIFNKKVHMWSLVIFNLIHSIILIGDLWYYRGFNSFLSLHLLRETQNLKASTTSAIAMGRPIDLIFLADIIFIIIIAIISRNYYGRLPKTRGIFIVIFILSFTNIYNHSNMFKDEWISLVTMRRLAPSGYHIYDSIQFINDSRPYIMTQKEKSDIKGWIGDKNENLPPNSYFGMFKGENLIVIQVESFENFVINQKYENQEITPNVNRLLKNSLYFTNYNEQVNNGNSSDADLMTNTSVYPVRRGSTFFRYPHNKYNTLPRILKEEGYATKAIHPDHGYIWNVKNALSNFGFDKFDDEDSLPIKTGFYMGLTDECLFNQTADILGKTKSPFYGFAVTTTSHIPFEMPKEFQNVTFSTKNKMTDYFQSINYTDKQIGKFIDTLDKKGLLDNTVVVIYGDHTSIHKYYGDVVSKIKPQESWWDNGKRIPLIIYSKNMEGKVIPTIGGQVDLLPTLAYIMGIPEDKYQNTSLGRNLLNTNRNFALLSNGTIVGKENLSDKEIKEINKSFEISDKIIRTDFFSKKH